MNSKEETVDCGDDQSPCQNIGQQKPQNQTAARRQRVKAHPISARRKRTKHAHHPAIACRLFIKPTREADVWMRQTIVFFSVSVFIARLFCGDSVDDLLMNIFWPFDEIGVTTNVASLCTMCAILSPRTKIVLAPVTPTTELRLRRIKTRGVTTGG
jgi:hypothetical protein